jgi:regulator of protease activity HflC (stomatin/prohibitin superfamily)
MILGLLFRFFILGILVFILFKLIIIIVPQSQRYLVERLGKFHKELSSGIHILIPLIDQIRFKTSLLEQSLSIKNLICTTKDQTQCMIQANCLFEVKDPIQYFYSADRNSITLQSITELFIKEEILNYYNDEIDSRRYGMNQSILSKLQDKFTKEGVFIKFFSIEEMNHKNPNF